jgi:hypothetical protein
MSLKIDISDQYNLYKKQENFRDLCYVLILVLMLSSITIVAFFAKNEFIGRTLFDYICGGIVFAACVSCFIFEKYAGEYFFSFKQALSSKGYFLNEKNQIEHDGKFFQFHQMKIDKNLMKFCFCECELD